MKDFLTAVMGGKHCGWCTDKPPTFMDKLCGFDNFNPTPWWGRVWWEVTEVFTHKVPIWKLGQRWHFKHHEGRY